MPSNVTPLIQPMDQNAIRLTKLFYRKKWLSDVLAKNDVGAALKAVTLRDAILNLNLAWVKLKPTVIRKCWHNILPQTHDFDEEDDIPLSVLKLRLRDEDPEYAQAEIMNILNLMNHNVSQKLMNLCKISYVLRMIIYRHVIGMTLSFRMKTISQKKTKMKPLKLKMKTVMLVKIQL